jgi:type II secretory pathway pseudopilin PulG
MKLLTARLSFRTRKKSREGKGLPGSEFGPQPAPGYALLILMMLVTVLLVSLTAALPSIYMQAQREREEELLFRGNEYARALLLFRQKFQRYPQSVDELVKKTNGIRFLRHAYKDPMTKSGKWRFIHATAQGIILDSKTTNAALQRGPGALGAPGSTPFGGAGSQGVGPQGATSQGTTSQEQEGATPLTPEQKEKACLQTAEQQSSGVSLGTFIAGVASCSFKASVRIWNGHTHYDEWEFLGVPLAPGGVMVPGGAQPGIGAPPTGTGVVGSSPGQTVSPQPAPPQQPPLTAPPPEEPQPEPEPEPEPLNPPTP